MVCEKITCQQCGFEVESGTRFCPECGTKITKPAPVCKACGETLSETEKFCHNCGARVQPDKVEEQPREEIAIPAAPKAVEAPVSPKKAKKPVTVSLIIKKSVALLLSILLMVFAFLPTLTISFDPEDLYSGLDLGDNVYVDLTAIDAIILYSDSLQSLDYEELYDSDLGEEYDDIIDDLSQFVQVEEDLESLDKEDKKDVAELLSKLYYVALRMQAQNEEFDAPSSALVSVIVAVVLFAACLAFFILATLDLVFTVLGHEKPVLWKCSASLLSAIFLIFVRNQRSIFVILKISSVVRLPRRIAS